MNVELSPKSSQALSRLNNPALARILGALDKLREEPPRGDIKALTGSDDFRVRVGGYRILFRMLGDRIVVLDIGTRGDIYKGR